MQKIIPFLWFDDRAEEAVAFYTSIFKDSKAGRITRFGPGGYRPEGMVMTASFELNGIQFTALNGGPEYHFTPAISLFVHCASQDEVDYYWDKLSQGGEPGPCGWLTDKFGVSWQVVPSALLAMLDDPDPEKVRRVTQAMLQMGKLELGELEAAYAGK